MRQIVAVYTVTRELIRDLINRAESLWISKFGGGEQMCSSSALRIALKHSEACPPPQKPTAMCEMLW
jgi:hypothetical protein